MAKQELINGKTITVYRQDIETVLYKKTIRLGKVDGYGNGVKNCLAVVEVEIKERDTEYQRLTVDLEPIYVTRELSMVGAIWNHISTDWVSGGQNYDQLLAHFPDNPKAAEMVKVWKRWHLNGTRAGTREQEAYLEEHDFPGYPVSYYDWACEVLKGAPDRRTLWQRITRQPNYGLYEDRGYKFGHKWLVEPLPDEVIAQVKSW